MKITVMAVGIELNRTWPPSRGNILFPWLWVLTVVIVEKLQNSWFVKTARKLLMNH